jgi:diphthamide biosynthesis enzyme Dph1/Dph2-like protein
MKLHFVEAKANVDVKLPVSVLKALPSKICLATDVQFVEKMPAVRKQLEKAGKEVSELKGAHAKYATQVLGCSHLKLQYPKATEAFLYIGDGFFHPKALLLDNRAKTVFVFNPFSGEFFTLTEKDVASVKRFEKVSMTKFLHAKKIGVLITVKPGQLGVQAHFNQILSLEKKFPHKKFYYLAFNTLDFSQLENFPFIECFVNTACTRLIDDYDKFPRPMVNIAEVLALHL